MIKLLKFLIYYCPILLERPDFRLKDSSTGPNEFAGASVLFESEDVQIFLSTERGQMSFEVRSFYDPKKKNWFSIDLISQLLGRPVNTGVLDKANSEFLSQNLNEIIAFFGKGQASGTIKKLNELKKIRTKRLFMK